MKLRLCIALSLTFPGWALAMDQSYMPIVGYTDKTGLMYGVAAFLYQDGRPGFETGIYGVTNGNNFDSITIEDQKRSTAMDLDAHATLSKTFDDYFGEGDSTPSNPYWQIDQNVTTAETSALMRSKSGWAAGPVLGLKVRQETGVESLDSEGTPAPSRAFPDSANPSLGVRALLETVK